MEEFKNNTDIDPNFDNKPRNYQDPNNENKHNNEKSIFKTNELIEKSSILMRLVLFLVGFFGLQAIALILSMFLSSLKNASFLVNFISYLIIFIAFTLILFLNKRKLGMTFLKEFKDYKVYIFGVAGFAIMFLMNLLFSLGYKNIPNYGQNLNQSGIEDMVSNNIFSNILLFLEIVIFAPYIEEFTYRLGLAGAISGNKRNYILGIIISSIVFGLIHFNGLSISLLQMQVKSVVAVGGSAGETAIKVIMETLNIKETLGSSLLSSENIDNIYKVLNIYMMNEWLNLPIYILSGLILNLAYFFSGKLASSFMTHFTNNLLSYISMFTPSNAVFLNAVFLI